MDGSPCIVCQVRVGKTVCVCAAGKTVLCEECVGGHLAKFPKSYHQSLPTSAFHLIERPNFLDNVKKRAEVIQIGKKLREQITNSFETCFSDLSAKVTGVIALLQSFAERKTEELKALQTAIDCELGAAIEELEAALYKEETDLSSEVSTTLLCDSSPDGFFEYTVDSSPYPTTLENFLIYKSTRLRQPSVDLTVNTLVSVYKNQLKIYNFAGAVLKQSKLGLSFSEGTRYIAVSAWQLLAAGGLPATSAVFSIETSTGSITAERDMSRRRDGVGLVAFAGCVYAFGGFDTEALTASEKFSLADKRWKPLPDMEHPRGAFCPCAHEDKIYLPDVRQTHGALEVFLPDANIFLTLSTFLPKAQKNSVSFISDGALIVVSSSEKTTRWIVGTEDFIVEEAFLQEEKLCSASCGPVVSSTSVFWIEANEGRLVAFDLECCVVRVVEAHRN